MTAEDVGFDPAFDLAPSAQIDFDDFFVFADNFGRSTAAAGKRVPLFAGLNDGARMYLDARTALPVVGEDFVLDVSLADFAAIKGYGLQVQYEADKLAFVEVRTDQPLGGSAVGHAAGAELMKVACWRWLPTGMWSPTARWRCELGVPRRTTEIENTVIEITDNQTYDSAFGFNRLALPAPVQVQTRPEVFALANNYPNPFNPATTIKYALPQAADVALTVYNVVGQPVRTLVAEHQSAGRYVVEWDATNDSGHSLSFGDVFLPLGGGRRVLRRSRRCCCSSKHPLYSELVKWDLKPQLGVPFHYINRLEIEKGEVTMQNSVRKMFPLAIALLLALCGAAVAGDNANVVISLDGEHAAAGAGEQVQVAVSAAGMVGVKQFEVTLTVLPADAFDLAATTFTPAFGFSPGVELLGDGQIKSGAAAPRRGGRWRWCFGCFYPHDVE